MQKLCPIETPFAVCLSILLTGWHLERLYFIEYQYLDLLELVVEVLVERVERQLLKVLAHCVIWHWYTLVVLVVKAE